MSELVGVKISKKKEIIIGWIFVIVLLVCWVCSLCFGWMKYQKYQQICTETMKEIYTEMGRSIKNDDAAFMNECRLYLSPDAVGDILAAGGLFGVDNSKEADEIRTLQASAKEAFEKKGYPTKWDLIYVFQYTDFTQYVKSVFSFSKPLQTSLINGILLFLFAIGLICVLITQIINNAHKNQEISIEDTQVRCKLNNKRTVDIQYSRINSVKRGPFKSVKIVSPGAKATISLLNNQIDIVNALTDKINQVAKS